MADDQGSKGPPFIHVSEEDVKRLVNMRDVIDVVGKALEHFSAGEMKGGVVQPVRTTVPVLQHEG